MMDNPHSLASFEWTERFARALDAVRATVDRRQFLDDLVSASIEVSGADRAHAILMEGSTVIAEAGRVADGSSFDVPEDDRKSIARVALAATRQAEDASIGVEAGDGTVLIPFIVKEGLAGAICLEREGSFDQASPEVILAISLVLSSARGLRSGEALAEASDRLTAAEARVKEVETAVASGGVGAVAYLKPVAELERDAIELALRTTKWNKEMAARRLGISRASIYMKVKKFGLQKPI